MKKLVIASAVAAVMASGAAAADTSVYGHMRLQVESAEQVSMESGKLVVGFKASEDLGNGMSAFTHLEMEHDGADAEGAGKGWTNDRSNVGIKGDFGTVTLGVQGDAASFACSGTDIFTNNSGDACSQGAVNGNLANALTYANAFGAVTVVAGITFDGDQDATNVSGAADDSGSNTVLALMFDGGNFTVGAQVTTLDGGNATGAKDTTKSVIGGTYTMGDFTAGLTIADNGAEKDPVTGKTYSDALAFAVSIGNVAGGTVKVGMDSGDALDKKKGANGLGGVTTNLEYTKSLSKAVYTGVQYSSTDLPSGADEAASSIWGYLGYKF
jgi:predicted porin